MIVGLQGKIGAGKSTAGKMFKKLGANVIDADKVGHSVLDKPVVKRKIADVFGNVLQNGKVSRKLLAKKAFTSRNSVKKLNKITHPLIMKEILKKCRKNRINIVEMPIAHKFDYTILIQARKEIRKRRIKEMQNRMKYESAFSHYDYRINNSGSLQKLNEQVKRIWRQLNESRNISRKL